MDKKKTTPGFNTTDFLVKVVLYGVLIFYALTSLLPFVAMSLTSIMTLGEANSTSQWRPKEIDFKTDITPCIVYAKDTFIEKGETITKNRWVIDISEDVSKVQRFDGTNYATPSESREPIFSIPFFSNYCAAWSAGNFGKLMGNTVKLVSITVTGTIIFAVLTAYAFARMDFAGKNIIFGIMLMTMMIPDIVRNLPNFLLVTEIGRFFGSGGLAIQPVAGWLTALGVDSATYGEMLGFATGFCDAKKNCWINNWPALTIPFLAPAFSIFLLRQHFLSIPDELWDAAQIDGAGHFRFLMQIVLPISKSALFVVLLFTFIGSWNALAWPILVTSGDEWRPISVGLKSFLDDEGARTHLQMAGSMITIFPILILYALTQRTFIEGLSQSGLKG